MQSIIQSPSSCGRRVYKCLCACECETIHRWQKLPIGGNAPVWPQRGIIFRLLLPADFVGPACMSLSPFVFFTQLCFDLFTCLHASPCQSVHHRATVGNKLVCSLKSSSRSALITVSVSVTGSVCHADRWSVYLCVFLWSHLAAFRLLDIERSDLPGPNQWLWSLTVYHFITKDTHTHEHIIRDK